MSGREHRGAWDISDAEWDARRELPNEDGPDDDRFDGPLYATPLDCTLRNLEDQINDLSAVLLSPELAPDAKIQIRAHAEVLRGVCRLLEDQ